MSVFSVPMKSGRRLAPDVSDTFSTHIGVVRDVIDLDCWV